MAQGPSSSSSGHEDTHDRLDEILADCHVRADRGERIDPEEVIRQHPEHGSLLRDYFAADERLAAWVCDAQRTGSSAAPTAVPQTLPRANCCIGDYQLLEEIGRGGMGVVYKARQLSVDRTVAVKMVLAGQLASEAEVRRFRSEAEAAAHLDHPGIVPVFAVGEYQGHGYFSMAYVDGESLKDRLARGPLSPREAARISEQVATAVAYAHGKGVIHRDLKPANVMVDPEGHVRVLDFGLAKSLARDSSLTVAGTPLGTPSYMPPEQARGELDRIDVRSDVYSLGATLYSLLTGRPPFQAESLSEVLLQVREQEPVQPRQLNPGLSLDLETVCLKCLEKEPRRRYQTMAEVAEELGRFLRGEPIRARPIGRLQRCWRWSKREPRIAALAGAVAISLSLGTVVSTIFAIQAGYLRSRAEQEARLEHALRLASRSREILPQHPKQSLSLALKALTTRLERAEAPPEEAATTLRDVLDANEERAVANLLNADSVQPRPTSSRAVVSPDNRWLVVACRDGTVRRWCLSADWPARAYCPLSHAANDVEFSITGDSRWLVAQSSRDARLWSLAAEDPAAASGDLMQLHASCSPGKLRFTLSPDSRWLIVPTCGCTQLFDMGAKKPWTDPAVLGRGPLQVTVSPDNRWLAAWNGNPAEMPAKMHVWELVARDPPVFVGTVASATGSFVFVGIRPGKPRLFALSQDDALKAWDLATGQPLGEPKTLGTADDWRAVSAAEFSSGGEWLMATTNRDIRIWDVTGDELIIKDKVGPDAVTAPGHTTSDGGPAAGLPRLELPKPELILPDLPSPQTPKPVPPPLAPPSSPPKKSDVLMPPVPDASKRPASVLHKKAVPPLVKPQPEPEREPAGDSEPVLPIAEAAGPTAASDGLAVKTSPDGQWVVAWARNSACLYELGPSRAVTKHPLPWEESRPIQSFLFSPDNAWLFAWSADAARLWKLTPAADPKMAWGHSGRILIAAISPDSDWLAVGDSGRRVLVWNLRAAEFAGQPTVLGGHEGTLASIAFTTDGRWLVTWDTWTVRLWDPRSGKNPPPVSLPTYLPTDVPLVGLSRNSRWLISGDGGVTAQLWDLKATKRDCWPKVLSGHAEAIHAVAITADDRWAVTGSGDKTVCLWDLNSPDPTVDPVVLNHSGAVIACAVSSRDGHWLATGCADGKVVVWPLPTEHRPIRPTVVLSGHTQTVCQTAFSPDSQYLLTADLDDVVLLWKLSEANFPPPCFLWYGSPARPPLLPKNPDDLPLIAKADRISSLWNERLKRFRDALAVPVPRPDSRPPEPAETAKQAAASPTSRAAALSLLRP